MGGAERHGFDQLVDLAGSQTVDGAAAVGVEIDVGNFPGSNLCPQVVGGVIAEEFCCFFELVEPVYQDNVVTVFELG